MTARTLVVEANVLLRADLGHKVIDSMHRFAAAASVTMLAPETAYEEAHRHMAEVLAKRGAGPAALLAADCPIWTQVRDFFGVGVATWTTALIAIYFSESAPGSEAS